MPRWVTLCFLWGKALPDPHELLKGEGSRVRHVRLHEPEAFDDPAHRRADRGGAGENRLADRPRTAAATDHQIHLRQATAAAAQSLTFRFAPGWARRVIMKFFVDTADTAEIRDLAETGLLDGVTTNPSLIHKAGRDFLEVVKEICGIVDGPGLGRGGRARP